MKKNPQRNDREHLAMGSEPPSYGNDPNPDAEQRFMGTLLENLSRHVRPVYRSLMGSNPDMKYLAEHGALLSRVRRALTGRGGVSLNARQQSLADRAAASAAEIGPLAGGDETEHDGVLTSLTRRLPPEKALELYRKIAPVLVYQILNHLEDSAPLDVLREGVDHLCSEEVQNRLRRCSHVRDAVLHEICTVLRRRQVRDDLTREDLWRLLEENGCSADLIAMENCIKLTRSRAG